MGPEKTCYIIDLSKGATAANSPGAGNRGRYQEWYPPWERELGLVAKLDAKIISIGGQVGGFLSAKGLYRHAGTIPRYSGSCVLHFGREIQERRRQTLSS